MICKATLNSSPFRYASKWWKARFALSAYCLLVALPGGLSAEVEDDEKVWTTRSEVACGRPVPARIEDQGQQFTDVTAELGIDYSHGCGEIARGKKEDRQIMAGGVAVGDYDRDGWPDLYFSGGSGGQGALYRNQKGEHFEERTVQAGVALPGVEAAGAVFADYDGDGWLDLLVTGVNESPSSLLRNMGNGHFKDVTAESGLASLKHSFSASFADYDRDGDLDLYVAHWAPPQNSAQLWRNNGDKTFSDITQQAGLSDNGMNDFAANFADIDNDGWLDLLIAADFDTSQIYRNNQKGGFEEITTDDITDENGMGTAVGDYDNDGDLDWFVSSIDSGGISGNRLYQNRGDGTFADVTEKTAVRYGGWAWGSCFADFNQDGYLDIFQVNGYGRPALNYQGESNLQTSVLFMSRGEGWFRGISFVEQAALLGVDDQAHGRGVSCMDYDRDGDLDIIVANNNQPPTIYRNNGVEGMNFLNIRLKGRYANSQAVGARIIVKADGKQQMRELRIGSNYLSQDLVEAHFGLNDAKIVDELHIVWPSQQSTTLYDVQVNQFLQLEQATLHADK